MKLVAVTAADLEQLKASLPARKAAPPAFHTEEMRVDSLSFGLARLETSDDPQANTYSIGFRCGDSDYTIVVRPTVLQVPSVTLNIIRDTEFASYTVVQDTVTTLKGQISGLPPDRNPSNFDLSELIGYVKLQG